MKTRTPLHARSSLFHHPAEETWIQLLKCVSHFRQFKQILACFFTNGLQSSGLLITKLIDFCSSASHMNVATSIFGQVPHPSPFVWTAMMRGLAENRLHHSCILFFREMRRRGTDPIHLTYPAVIKGCAGSMAVLEGIQVHTDVLKTGFVSDIYVQNGLLGMYAKCGLMENARQLYDEIPQRDIVSHTSIISGYFGAGDLASAQLVFDGVEEADVILWSAVVAGYSQNGAPAQALHLFERMSSLGIKPNSITMVSVISACAQLRDFQRGKWAHNLMMETGIKMDMLVCTSLLDLYIKGGFFEEACKIFNQMPIKDVVSWNSLIIGYAQNGYATEAMGFFTEMLHLGIEPNRVTLLGVLSSCAQLGALDEGKEIEHLVEKLGLQSDLSIGTALLDMYAKCGSLSDANRIFCAIYPRDVVMWSALINGYATNGHQKETLSLLGGMLKTGIQPNGVTCVGILKACSHRGLVQQGYEHFDTMISGYGIEPRTEHYACMVDILGRSGRIEEAKKFIDSMPMEPGASIWGSLLGACVTHKNIEVGQYAAQHLNELEPLSDQNFVFMSNIYAAMNRWEDVHNTRSSLKCGGAHKTPGCSWIEVTGKIHEFLVGDRAHPMCCQIYEILDSLTEQLRLVGNCSVNEA
ncbi:pentatricopeptide repeat-containing protein At1g08070, chloroplastic-like [Aristolochia californica]|uniref:pentatricopeptide repeat-containing protein At1g08070, chloroplastic-like n=1 Tax=Aristolochia californica TaxID=171875 RepID=UPI0035DD3587